VTAEVKSFSEVRPESARCQFELLPAGSDSDDQTSSSGAGTPVPHQVTLVPVHDRLLQAADPGPGPAVRSGSPRFPSGPAASSASVRSGSRSPMMNTSVEVVKSSEASQWRKEAMEGASSNDAYRAT